MAPSPLPIINASRDAKTVRLHLKVEPFDRCDGAICCAAVNGGHRLVERTLRPPSPGYFLMDVVAGRPISVVRNGRWRPDVDDVCGGSLEEVTQGAAYRLVDWYVIEGLQHVLHPRIPLLCADFETQMRFAQAQPPPPLRVLRRTPQELSQEGGELFNCAPESLAREQRSQYGIPFDAGVKRRGEFAACLRAANGLIQVEVVHDVQGCIGGNRNATTWLQSRYHASCFRRRRVLLNEPTITHWRGGLTLTQLTANS